MCQASHQVSFGFNEQTFPAGLHICYLYNNENERRRTIAEFVQSGLAAGEKVAYLADIPSTPSSNEMGECLSQLGISPPGNIKPEQLILAQAETSYCPDGTFMPERVIDHWRALYRQAQHERFAGVRMTGDTSWLCKGMPGAERWVEYEAMLNTLVEEYPVHGVICQYDVNKIDGATLFDVLNVHPMMIVAGQVVHNPYYQRPKKHNVLASAS
ncbi:MEDS domain-containing protein [Methylobacter sp. sgz302048]|uniref:MEDS domain-containing protein n=1 Tax=Methylobacter sp. sgz302048 TaxID=3455945 RepID=UPI003FA0EAE9